jgi:hypothetical protein
MVHLKLVIFYNPTKSFPSNLTLTFCFSFNTTKERLDAVEMERDVLKQKLNKIEKFYEGILTSPMSHDSSSFASSTSTFIFVFFNQRAIHCWSPIGAARSRSDHREGSDHRQDSEAFQSV